MELISNIEAMGGLKRAYIKKSMALAKGTNVLITASELAEFGITNPWQQVMAVHGRIGTNAFPHPAMDNNGNSNAEFRVNIVVNNPQITAICAGEYSSRMVCVVLDYIDLD